MLLVCLTKVQKVVTDTPSIPSPNGILMGSKIGQKYYLGMSPHSPSFFICAHSDRLNPYVLYFGGEMAEWLKVAPC